MRKDYCPGKLDLTPRCVVAFGESYQDNAIREIYEEMGIAAIYTCRSNKKQNGRGEYPTLAREHDTTPE